MNTIHKNRKRGFTLLEIILVIAAIGILAAIVLVAINPNRQLAQVRNAERRSEINTIYKAIEQYLIETGSYPAGITTAIQDICINGNTTNCVNLGVLVPDYIAAIPIDPQGVAYKVAINAVNNRVSVYASNAELGQVIVVNNTWTPANITTALWLDAADASTITTVSSTVSEWRDKSGNTRHVSQATSANRPTYAANSLNGLPGIDWGSALNSKFLGRTPISYTMDRVYGVAVWNGPSAFENYECLVSFGGVGGGNTYQGGVGGPAFFGASNLFLNGGSTSTDVVLPTISQPFIFAAAQSTTGTRISLQIGRDGNTNRGWRGLIYELILSASPLSLADQQRIEGYLAHKWGLTNNLPANHPYKNSAP